MQSYFKKDVFYAYIWGFMRVFLSLMTTVFSQTRPSTPIEQHYAIWPPLAELGIWLYRVFLIPWLRWDSIWYVGILVSGYQANDGTTSFHPLYLMLSKAFFILGFDPVLSLMLTSSIASLALFFVFYKLASLDLDQQQSQFSLLLLAAFPISFILFAPYTESTFLFFTVLTLYGLRKRRWGMVALATTLAVLTRQQGVFLIIPMLWYVWQDYKKAPFELLKAWRIWLALVSAPAGMIVWTIYRLSFLHEGTMEFRTLQGFIYSVVLSPSTKKIIPDQTLTWPWVAFSDSVVKLLETMQVQGIVNLTIGLGFVFLFLLAWKQLNIADRLYSLTIVLVSFSLSIGTNSTYDVYMSLPRHMLPAIPVFIGLAKSLDKAWQQRTIILIQILVQIFALMLYVFHIWIP